MAGTSARKFVNSIYRQIVCTYTKLEQIYITDTGRSDLMGICYVLFIDSDKGRSLCLVQYIAGLNAVSLPMSAVRRLSMIPDARCYFTFSDR